MKHTLIMLFCLAHISVLGQINNPAELVGDTLVVKDNQTGYRGFVKNYRLVNSNYFSIDIPSDSNVLLNDGSGKTPYEKLNGRSFVCRRVIPFTSDSSRSFLEIHNDEYGTVYYKYNEFKHRDYPFLDKEQYKAFSERQKSENRKRAYPKITGDQLILDDKKVYHYSKVVSVLGQRESQLVSKVKDFLKKYTESAEGTSWEQVKGKNIILSSVTVRAPRLLIMEVNFSVTKAGYTYDIRNIEYQYNDTWRPSEIVLGTTKKEFDQIRDDVVEGINNLIYAIETGIR
jgi:hypothetical protein